MRTEVTQTVNFEKGLWLIAHDRIVTVPVIDRDGSPKDLTGEELEYVVRATRSAAGLALITKTVSGGGLVLSSDPDATNNLVSIHLARSDTFDGNLVLVPDGKYYHTLRRANVNNYIALFEGYVWITATAAR